MAMKDFIRTQNTPASGASSQTWQEYQAQKNQSIKAAPTWQEYQAARTASPEQQRVNMRNKAYEASGYDLLTRDMESLNRDLASFMDGGAFEAGARPRAMQARVQAMQKALEQEQAYFKQYAGYFDLKDLNQYQRQISQWSQGLEGYNSALGAIEAGVYDTGFVSLLREMEDLGQTIDTAITTEGATEDLERLLSAQQQVQTTMGKMKQHLQESAKGGAMASPYYEGQLRQLQQWEEAISQALEAKQQQSAEERPWAGSFVNIPTTIGTYQEASREAQRAEAIQTEIQKSNGQRVLENTQQIIDVLSGALRDRVGEINPILREKEGPASQTSMTAQQAKAQFEALETHLSALIIMAAAGNLDAPDEAVEKLLEQADTLKEAWKQTYQQNNSEVNQVLQRAIDSGEYGDEDIQAMQETIERQPVDEYLQQMLQASDSFATDIDQFEKEYEYQKGYLTREKVPYMDTDKLLDMAENAAGFSGKLHGEEEREIAAITAEASAIANLANREMSKAQYDRYLEILKQYNEAGYLEPQDIERFRLERMYNGLQANIEGMASAQQWVPIGGWNTVLPAVSLGLEGARDTLFQTVPGAADQALTRGAGYIAEGLGDVMDFLHIPGAESVQAWGETQQGYESEEMAQAARADYARGRATQILAEGVDNEIGKWMVQQVPGMAQSILTMATTGMLGRYLTAASPGVQLMASGAVPSASGLQVAGMEQAPGLVQKGLSYMGKHLGTGLMAGTSAAGAYAQAVDLNDAERALYALASGAVEFFTEQIGGGNPFLDAGDDVIGSWINQTIKSKGLKRVLGKVMDITGEGLEEVLASIGTFGLDYALRGEGELTLEGLRDDFLVGAAIGGILTGSHDAISGISKAIRAVKLSNQEYFSQEARNDLNTLNGEYKMYLAAFLLGDNDLMKKAGWSEAQRKTATEKMQDVTYYYNLAYNRLAEKGQEASWSDSSYDQNAAIEKRISMVENGSLGDLQWGNISEDYAMEAVDDLEEAWKELKASGSANTMDIAQAARLAQQVMDITVHNAKQRNIITQEQKESAQQRLGEIVQEAKTMLGWEETSSQKTEETQNTASQAAMEEGAVSNEAAIYETAGKPGGRETEKRYGDLDSREQAGNLERTGYEPAPDTERAANERRNSAETVEANKRLNRILSMEKYMGLENDTSPAELLPGGTEEKTLAIVPEGMWTEDMRDVANRASERGISVTYVKGSLQAKVADGETRRLQGFYNPNTRQIFATVNDLRFAPEMIAEHELMHEIASTDNSLVQDVLDHVQEILGPEEMDKIVEQYILAYAGVYDDPQDIYEEIVADAYAGMNRFQEFDPGKTQPVVRDVVERRSVDEEGYPMPMPPPEEVKYSLQEEEKLLDAARLKNEETDMVSDEVMDEAAKVRAEVAKEMRRLHTVEAVALPEDIKGNTAIGNSAYGITEENTTICPRSLAAEAFVDAVSEYVERPLTVEEQVFVSQDLQNRSKTPECMYCYVATDRKAYRAFLGEYIRQRDAVIDAYRAGQTDTSRTGELYRAFLDGRKDTVNMWNRFKMWTDTYKHGKKMVSAADLTNIKKLMGDLEEFGPDLKPQIKDAMQYAQSASWAKKRVSYVAYNGHILKWTQRRINELNSMYGLRMYSFSDFSPAFILENMQMITDAAVRGLKVLAYTKELDFARIFAPSGININVSCFGFEMGDQVVENAMTGAPWAQAKELRKQYENVGVTFVATSDKLVKWAMAQDWIDVVIPYHLVRTGTTVAKMMGYTNYTAESADQKIDGWEKDTHMASISPAVHNNDKATYLRALEENKLKPRFKRFLGDENYMKLVNETRRSAANTPSAQPVFDLKWAKASLKNLERDGYYKPIGDSVERMYEIAEDVAKRIKIGLKFSLDNEYFTAIESDDMDTAQRMVDEAASDAGYTIRAYHGTNADRFTVFDKERVGKGTDQFGAGFYFGTTKDIADAYGYNVYDVWLNIQNPIKIYRTADGGDLFDVEITKAQAYKIIKRHPLMYDKEESPLGDWFDSYWEYGPKEWMVRELAENYLNIGVLDSDLFRSYPNELHEAIKSVLGYDGVEVSFDNADSKFYVAWFDNQMKEAAPVTYDGNGNVIPLSERFDTGKRDIRYSLSDERQQSLQEAYYNAFRNAEREARIKRWGFDIDKAPKGFRYGKNKPFYSATTTLSPREAKRALEAITGKQWLIQTSKSRGTWKAVIRPDVEVKQGDITADEAWEKILGSHTGPGAPGARTVKPYGITKEDFTATPALDKIGVKIDGSVTDYEITPKMVERYRAVESLDRLINKTVQKFKANDKEKNFARDIAAGKYSYFDIPQNLRFHVVTELAGLYIDRRMQGEDLITVRRRALNEELLLTAASMFPNENELTDEENPAYFKPEKLLTMNYRTPERAMMAMFGEERGKQLMEYFFDPVARNEAERLRWMTKQFDEVRTFKDSKGRMKELTKEESAYVHMLLDLEGYVEKVERNERSRDIKAAAENVRKGENLKDNAVEFGFDREQTDLVEKYAQWMQAQAGKGKNLDEAKCRAAAEVYRNKFNDYYTAIVDFLVAHGNLPIGHIEYYSPHFTANDKVNLLNQIFETLGYNANVTRLPAEIAGKTEEFKPNKRWTPFFQHRTGDTTDYDIVEGFESYVTYISDVLFHHDDILKIRAAEQTLRAGMEGDLGSTVEDVISMARSGDLEKQRDWLIENRIILPETALTEEVVANAFDQILAEYAGEEKQRTRYSDLVVWLKNYGDVLAGKQFGGDRGTEYMGGRELLNVVNRMVRSFSRANVAGNLSSALNQVAQIPMILSSSKKTSVLRALRDIMGMMTSQKVRNDMQAFAEASDFKTGKKGVKYLKNEGTDKLISAMFQPLEVMDRFVSTLAARSAYYDAIAEGMTENEAMRYADKQARRVMGDRTKGSKPLAFHSKGPFKQMINMFQIEALNAVEFVGQDLPRKYRQTARQYGKTRAAKQIASDILAYLLAAFLLNRLAEEFYGGTPAPFDLGGYVLNFIASGYGVSGNDLLLGRAQTSEDFDIGAALEDAGYNLSNEIPFISNLSALLGVGDKTLPMPDIYGGFSDLIDAVGSDGVLSEDALQALIALGSQAIPGGRQISKTYSGLEALLRGGKFSGSGDNERLQFMVDRSVGGVLRNTLFGVNATPEANAYYATPYGALTAKQTRVWKAMGEMGVDQRMIYDVLQNMAAVDREELTGAEQDQKKRALITNTNMPDSMKAYMYAQVFGTADTETGVVGTTYDQRFQDLMDLGLTWAEVMEMFDEFRRVYNDDTLDGSSAQAVQFAAWIDDQEFEPAQRVYIKENFLYYTPMPANTDTYDKLVSGGVEPQEAVEIINRRNELAGDKDVTVADKYNAILGQGLSEEETYQALGAVMTESAFEKLTAAKAGGVGCDDYIEFWEATKDLESDDNSTRKEKVMEYIQSMGLSSRQKDALYFAAGYKESTIDEAPWH